jgi:hypothetical protein
MATTLGGREGGREGGMSAFVGEEGKPVLCRQALPPSHPSLPPSLPTYLASPCA